MTQATARKLFGTDGIRAVAGESPLDANTIFACGLALGHSLHKTATEPRVILGRDTRESGPWIAATLAAGLRESGAHVESAGVITTPAVAFLARTHGFHAGVVISASHNPALDNGIKYFSAEGGKFLEVLETGLEKLLGRTSPIGVKTGVNVGRVENVGAQAVQAYTAFWARHFKTARISGLRLVADLAALHPAVASGALVPVGLTRHRQGLPGLSRRSGQHLRLGRRADTHAA